MSHTLTLNCRYPHTDEDAEFWYKVICAILQKDYAVGYLLLTLMGHGTLVLSSLMTVLNGAQVRGACVNSFLMGHGKLVLSSFMTVLNGAQVRRVCKFCFGATLSLRHCCCHRHCVSVMVCELCFGGPRYACAVLLMTVLNAHR